MKKFFQIIIITLLVISSLAFCMKLSNFEIEEKESTPKATTTNLEIIICLESETSPDIATSVTILDEFNNQVSFSDSPAGMDESSRVYYFDLPIGTYTITATRGEESQSTTYTVADSDLGEHPIYSFFMTEE